MAWAAPIYASKRRLTAHLDHSDERILRHPTGVEPDGSLGLKINVSKITGSLNDYPFIAMDTQSFKRAVAIRNSQLEGPTEP
jgi:hypothetical protein